MVVRPSVVLVGGGVGIVRLKSQRGMSNLLDFRREVTAQSTVPAVRDFLSAWDEHQPPATDQTDGYGTG